MKTKRKQKPQKMWAVIDIDNGYVFEVHKGEYVALDRASYFVNVLTDVVPCTVTLTVRKPIAKPNRKKPKARK